MVAWQSAAVSPDPDGRIRANAFGVNGAALDDEFVMVNPYDANGVNGQVRLASNAFGGDLVLVWERDGILRGQRFEGVLFGGLSGSFENNSLCGWSAFVGNPEICP